MPEYQLGSVVPVVDYEASIPDTAPHRTVRRRQAASVAPADAAAVRAAGAFADATLRRVLEVIDRRRSLAQLRPLLAPGLVDSLLAAAGRHGGVGAAQLQRVRVQLVRRRGQPVAAEIAASYARSGRVHAIAARVEQARTVTGFRWQVVALHIG